MSDRDNPTMQIVKTAKEVKRFQQQEIVVRRRARFGSKSSPGIARSTEWKKDELGNPTRQVGDVTKHRNVAKKLLPLLGET